MWATMKIVDSRQMRNIDARAIREFGIPGLVLMENAGSGCADALEEMFEDLEPNDVVILCGKGNNGGDGFVLARHLRNRGLSPRVIALRALDEVQGDAQTNLRILQRIGLEVEVATDVPAWDGIRPGLDRHRVLVDALLGTGLRGPVRGFLRHVIASLAGYPGHTVSLDIPSGLSADSPRVPGEAVVADHTLTLGLPKIAHLFPPAELFCGGLTVLDISLPAEAVDAEGIGLQLIEEATVERALPPRPREAHKGDFGRILLVAGSRGKPGAAALAALGALRSGAGLVTVSTGRSAQPMIAAHAPEIMVEPLPETERGTLSRKGAPVLLKQAAAMDALVVGPGLGTGADVSQILRKLADKVECPLVIDADGLNAFARNPSALEGSAAHPRILTPHPGEMARLVGKSTADVQADRIGIARRFARDHGCYVVLKGYRTLVATPAGEIHVNPTGNPGMATAGTGDVLSGMIGALIAQAREPLPGLLAAVYLHGLAGDLAAAGRGEVGMTATDLLALLPEATRVVRGEIPED
jgi:NAD(P)H-hydrate epimerase